jgi:hypothetical protein
MPDGTDPEQNFRDWFMTLPLWQRHALAYFFYLMTSAHSGDFALSGAESLQRFEADLGSGDFPIRRVARLLSIRAVFSFIYADEEFARQFVLTRRSDLAGDPTQIAAYQWMRDAHSWQRLCDAGLSDRSLHRWLAALAD